MNNFLGNMMKKVLEKGRFLSPRGNRRRDPYSEFVNLFNFYNVAQLPPDGLLLGDSVAERISWNDSDKRTLAQMMASNMADKFTFSSISYSAFNLKIFYYFVKALQEMRYKPKFIVLPINMRSFSPQWDFEPSWQFEREINLIQDFISDPTRLPFSSFEKRDLRGLYEEFDSTFVNYRLTSLNRIGHFRLVINGKPATVEQKKFRTAQIFIFHYTYNLLAGHRKLDFLKKIMSLLQEMKIRGILYVTPINIEAGNKYVGDSFSDSVAENVAVVKESIADFLYSCDNIFIDYSSMLSSEYFFYADDPTEHLNQDGRQKLASCIVSELKK